MKIALYNPLSLLRTGRILQIAIALQCDVICLVGTCIRSRNNDTHTFANVNEDYWVLHCGYGSGPFTNKSAGCSIIFKKKIFPRSCIQQLCFPPKELQGRGICIRCKKKCLDTTFIVGYVPPHGNGANPAARKGADLTNRWLRKQYEKCPMRSAPFLALDANTQMGIDQQGLA